MIQLIEKPVPYKVAAAETGFPEWKLRRAGKRRLFPVYKFYNSRELVKVSEVLAAVVVVPAIDRSDKNENAR